MIEEGARAPDFTLPDQDGEPVTLFRRIALTWWLAVFVVMTRRSAISAFERTLRQERQHLLLAEA